ncbi:MAG: S-methyl-5-thioribose-1-phosphate isomerase [Bacteroidetes bacterium]|nr:S-methyl-5-thioribose-1-phosphate isomerase [Bacteroidota bacterium]
MKVGEKHYHTVWQEKHGDDFIIVIDQRRLPFEFITRRLSDVGEVSVAIGDMSVRGAPLIGVVAAYGMYLAALKTDEYDWESKVKQAAEKLKEARPTAVNLSFAVTLSLKAILKEKNRADAIRAALEAAEKMKSNELEACLQIGLNGLELIREIARKKDGKPVNILTHCNAGWLACIDYGTATAPIYMAHDEGIPVHVWVDETRPRNQGARLTAWELEQHGVPFTLIADNTGGHLMQRRMVDIVIVGTDRTTTCGDVANKIGTYLKALAAKDNNVPFYVAAPSSSIDWSISDGIRQIPIEERSQEEVTVMDGVADGKVSQFRITTQNCKAVNYGFDVTPARLITGLITERGICESRKQAILKLFPENL